MSEARARQDQGDTELQHQDCRKGSWKINGRGEKSMTIPNWQQVGLFQTKSVSAKYPIRKKGDMEPLLEEIKQTTCIHCCAHYRMPPWWTLPTSKLHCGSTQVWVYGMKFSKAKPVAHCINVTFQNHTIAYSKGVHKHEHCSDGFATKPAQQPWVHLLQGKGGTHTTCLARFSASKVLVVLSSSLLLERCGTQIEKEKMQWSSQELSQEWFLLLKKNTRKGKEKHQESRATCILKTKRSPDTQTPLHNIPKFWLNLLNF